MNRLSDAQIVQMIADIERMINDLAEAAAVPGLERLPTRTVRSHLHDAKAELEWLLQYERRP